MLQCAAVTGVPFAEALLALATMEGGPEHPPDVLAQDDYLLRDLTTRAVTSCAYFDHHPGPRSFSVSDPLGDLVTLHIHGEIQRLGTDDDNAIDRDSS
ncbi:hypothetical protein ACH4KN_07670 [Streptomyces sp. NPDC017546]|uniref:hypothetical protein n=1 Tax=Streptomyces sp. NPDC017546 TaxID=3365001 RepID=UPI003792EC2A